MMNTADMLAELIKVNREIARNALDVMTTCSDTNSREYNEALAIFLTASDAFDEFRRAARHGVDLSIIETHKTRL